MEAEADKDSDKLNSAAKRAEVMIKRITKDSLKKVTQDELDNIIDYNLSSDQKLELLNHGQQCAKNFIKDIETLEKTLLKDIQEEERKLSSLISANHHVLSPKSINYSK